MGTQSLRRWLRRLRYWRKRDERARLLREEMDIHIEMLAHRVIENGVSESDARNTARRQFGNPAQRQEESRETWIARWLDDFAHDTLFAIRTLRKQPGFTAVASLSAALGIGACSLIFGIANFALFHPLPVSDPSRLMSISGSSLVRGRSGQSMSYPDFADLQKAASFQGMTAYFPFVPAVISSEGEPRRYWGSLVTANYFDVVQPPFVIGHGFNAAADDLQGETPSVVLSFGLWRSRFNSDPSMVGQTIDLNNHRVTVVGVTAPGFRGTEAMFYSEFWLPLSTMEGIAASGRRERLEQRSAQWLQAVGRLRPGLSERIASAEIDVIAQRLRSAYPATNRERAFHVERAGQINPGVRKMATVFFLMLMAVAIMVLATACANVANLLLARSASRGKEIATRLAIGAGRGRLVRQMLTESVLLALIGGAGGYALAELGARAMSTSRLPISMPVDLAFSLDGHVVLFCVALAGLTGLTFGLLPAWRATRPDLVRGLKDQPLWIGRSRLTLRNLLVIAQVGTCTILLICSGLFLRSLHSAGKIDIGFSPQNLLLVSLDPNLSRYSPDEISRTIESVMERADRLPGVESATLTSSVPLNLEGTQNGFLPDDVRQQSPITADIYSVWPRFFQTLRIPVLAGEDFRPAAAADDVVILNQTAAAKAFSGSNPIGRHIRYFGRSVRVVGLVATTKSRSIGEDPRPALYFPMARELRGNDSGTGMTLILRTHGNPALYSAAVRQTVRDLDPGLALFDIRTMDAQLSRALFAPRAAAILFGLAGAMGLLIAVIGIYGVITFMVARQFHEIGIRMALGARRGQILGRVLRQGLALAGIGCALGIILALALSHVAASLLYGVSTTDVLTFVAVPVTLLSVALIACMVPARRAATMDPLVSLRQVG